MVKEISQPPTKENRQFCIFCELPLSIIEANGLHDNITLGKSGQKGFIHIEHILDLLSDSLAVELLSQSKFILSSDINNDTEYKSEVKILDIGGLI